MPEETPITPLAENVSATAVAEQSVVVEATEPIFDFDDLMREVLSSRSPDLHMQAGQHPIVRLRNGSIAALNKYPVLVKEDIEKVIQTITNEEQKKRMKEKREFDFSYHIQDFGRFRVNVYKERHGPAIAFRLISEKIPTLEEIGLGKVVEDLLQFPHGLILVTGPTGMGKSTTLASMIDYLNAHRQSHIITIEDPIEYVYKNKNCLITQREVNVHTDNFSNAIRAALRQDPDIVMVGEMRDLETISAAMTLAETGHLVFSTLHTPDAAQTVDRIIDVFPAYQQQQIKTQLGNTLRGVISQVLIPRLDGEGRVAAREIMINNDAIRNTIIQGQVHQIYSIIQLNSADGMVLMDQSLESLVRNGMISKEDALAKANDIEALTNELSQI
ncbi:type IV pilus twitching motility protein PilT [candidate division KSB1 bacterium]